MSTETASADSRRAIRRICPASPTAALRRRSATACGCTTSTRGRATRSSACTASRRGAICIARWCRCCRTSSRVVAVDMVGFGRSDKPAGQGRLYVRAALHDAVARSSKRSICNGLRSSARIGAGCSGLPIAADMPERFARLVIMNTGLPTSGKPTERRVHGLARFRRAERRHGGRPRHRQGPRSRPLTPEIVAAYDAPYPDGTYKGGALKFPLLGAHFRGCRSPALHAADGREVEIVDQAGAGHVFGQGPDHGRRRRVFSSS